MGPRSGERGERCSPDAVGRRTRGFNGAALG